MAGARLPAEVLIVGGGVAALEAMMALHDLAGDRVRVTLVAPDADFVHRPLAVAEPFALGEARSFPLREITADFAADFVRAGAAEVDGARRRVVLRSGDTIAYDAVVLAHGARTLPAFDGLTFTGPESGPAMRTLLDELERGGVRKIAFVAPTAIGWTLPLYELALLTARHAKARDAAAELVLVTPETRPLALFGEAASAAVAELLDAGGIEFIGDTYARTTDGAITLWPGGRALDAERLVALPLLRGRLLEGVPVDDFGFVPVDRYGRVEGLVAAYAAGDVTTFPVKQGGLATQQADAVAEHIAAHHGADVQPSGFRPVLRGLLFAGGPELYLRLEGAAPGTATAQALWWPPTKIAGRYLAPYLHGLDPGVRPGPAPAGFTDLEVPLEPADEATVQR
jgi:sulfide:quinone oxidoreductase